MHRSPVVTFFLNNPGTAVTREQIIESGVDYSTAQGHLAILFEEGCLHREGRRGHYLFQLKYMPKDDVEFPVREVKKRAESPWDPWQTRVPIDFRPYDREPLKAALREVKGTLENQRDHPSYRLRVGHAEATVIADFVYQEILEYPEIIRSELASRLGLTTSKVQSAINVLFEQGRITSGYSASWNVKYFPLDPKFPEPSHESEKDSQRVLALLTHRSNTELGLANDLGWSRDRVKKSLSFLNSQSQLSWIAIGQLLVYRLREE